MVSVGKKEPAIDVIRIRPDMFHFRRVYIPPRKIMLQLDAHGELIVKQIVFEPWRILSYQMNISHVRYYLALVELELLHPV